MNKQRFRALLHLVVGTGAMAIAMGSVASSEYMGSVSSASTAGAVSRVDGTVWMWGAQTYGQLGDGVSRGSFSMDRVEEPQLVSGLTGVVHIASGGLETYAIMEDGTFWGWGRNDNGELGDGTESMRLRPVQLPVPGNVAISHVSAGGRHALAVDAEGKVRSAGDDRYGQLGDGGGAWNSVAIPSGEKVVDVAAGSRHSVALTDDGRVWTWGSNDRDALGREIETWTEQSSPGAVPALDGHKVIAVAAGDRVSAALTDKGDLYTWGSRLDLARGRSGGSEPEPVTIDGGLAGQRPLVMGIRHGFIQSEDGGLLAWGRNAEGQLGIGSTTDTRPPAPVQAFDGSSNSAAVLGAGSNRSFAIDAQYRLHAWGSNRRAALGVGDSDDRTTPASVLPAEASDGTLSTAFAGEGVMPFYLLPDPAVGDRGWRVSSSESLSGDYSIEPESEKAGERAAIAIRGHFHEGSTLAFAHKLTHTIGELSVRVDGETLWRTTERAGDWEYTTLPIPASDDEQTISLVWFQTADAPDGNGVWIDNVRLPAGQLGSEAILTAPVADESWADAVSVSATVTPLVDELELDIEYRPEGSDEWQSHGTPETVGEARSVEMVVDGLKCGRAYELRTRAKTPEGEVETSPVSSHQTSECGQALGRAALRGRSQVRLSFSLEMPDLYHGYEGLQDSRNDPARYELLSRNAHGSDSAVIDAEFEVVDGRLEVDLLGLDCGVSQTIDLGVTWEAGVGGDTAAMLDPVLEGETMACTGGLALRENSGPAEDECFIATAAHGSLMAPDVQVLRRFRDQVLARSEAGRVLIRGYYRYGEQPARLVASNEFFKTVVRALLVPVVAVAWLLLNPWMLFSGCIALGLGREIVREVV